MAEKKAVKQTLKYAGFVLPFKEAKISSLRVICADNGNIINPIPFTAMMKRTMMTASTENNSFNANQFKVSLTCTISVDYTVKKN